MCRFESSNDERRTQPVCACSCPFSFCRHVWLSHSRPRPWLFLQQQVHAAGCGGKQQVPVHGSGGQHWVQRQRMPCGKAAQCRLYQKANQGHTAPVRRSSVRAQVMAAAPAHQAITTQLCGSGRHRAPTHCCAAQRSARARGCAEQCSASIISGWGVGSLTGVNVVGDRSARLGLGKLMPSLVGCFALGRKVAPSDRSVKPRH
jgi:hypothetical protein